VIGVAAFATVAVAACGGSGPSQTSGEPSGKFPVAVTTASFPARQRLAERTRMVISVRNDGDHTIPNIAVSVCNTTCNYPAPPGQGTSAQAFSYVLNQPDLASASRPIWIVDRPPGVCTFSCPSGGPGGAETAYSNTWALGPLPRGATATFQWNLTAVKAGRYIVAWQIAAGLTGNAKAVLADGSLPEGTFKVDVSTIPRQAYVNSQGKVVYGPQR
jgi:hypothetical protein